MGEVATIVLKKVAPGKHTDWGHRTTASTLSRVKYVAVGRIIYSFNYFVYFIKTNHTYTHRPLHAMLWGLSIVLSFVILLPNTPWLCARKRYGDIKMSPQLRCSHTLTQLWGHPCPHNSATARAHTHTQSCVRCILRTSYCSPLLFPFVVGLKLL